MLKKFLLALSLVLGLAVTPQAQIINSTQPQNLTVTGSAYTNATTTFSNVTGLSFTAAASTTYQVTCQILWQGTANTTGPKYQWTGPASPTAVAAAILSTITTANPSTFITASATAFSSAMANVGTVTTATNQIDILTLTVVNGTTAGAVQLQSAANGAGTLTIQVGSSCRVQ